MPKASRWLESRFGALLEAGHSFRRPELSILVFGGAIVFFALVPPEALERLPSLSLWERLFGYSPSTGTLRALVSLFHGRVRDALDYNWNVLVTAPLVVGYFLLDVAVLVRRALSSRWLWPNAGAKPGA